VEKVEKSSKSSDNLEEDRQSASTVSSYAAP
jgi:hypothetical protein